MPTERANHPISLVLRPDLADGVDPRAEGLGLTRSGYLGALVWNDSTHPDSSLAPLPNPKKLARVELTCSLRAPLRALAARRAAALGMSLNAYIEALIAKDLTKPRAVLPLHFRD